jgi:hypothetical protein
MAYNNQYRKTRIVCVSDTHNTTPPFPKGDILIHAGDLTNQGSLSELQKAVDWISKAPYEVKIVVAGNHDITLDPPFYAEHGLSFHNQHPQNPADCVALLQNAAKITYLNHSSAYIKLTDANGPRTHFNVFGSPYSPDTKGLWAFRYASSSPQATTLWSQIPLNTDILTTHTPPYSHCDASVTKTPKGCEELRKALWRVRPKLHVCGHLHEGRGAEKVRWKLDAKFMEENTEFFWDDPGRGVGNRKQSLVDLSAKGAWRLDHEAATDSGDGRGREVGDRGKERGHVRFSGVFEESAALNQLDASSCGEKVKAKLTSKCIKGSEKSSGLAGGSEKRTTAQDWSKQAGCSILDESVQDAIEGRLGRKETCIVNAAIMANSWGRPKRFNKPIVVDIDLPVWDDWMEDVGDAR